jgi:hypothetical protein
LLAYVFWHWRRPDVDRATYAGRVAAFHEALRRSAPEGFVASCAFRAGAVPWLEAEETYEDWYVNEGSYALDPLNDGAVAGDCQAPHDAAARSAAGGTAGLYRLRQGSPKVREATWSCWFAKLGPTPEFCLLAAAKPVLPADWEGIERPLERIWPTTVEGLPQESMNF